MSLISIKRLLNFDKLTNANRINADVVRKSTSSRKTAKVIRVKPFRVMGFLSVILICSDEKHRIDIPGQTKEVLVFCSITNGAFSSRS